LALKTMERRPLARTRARVTGAFSAENGNGAVPIKTTIRT
jgi:hypothetical protein